MGVASERKGLRRASWLRRGTLLAPRSACPAFKKCGQCAVDRRLKPNKPPKPLPSPSVSFRRTRLTAWPMHSRAHASSSGSRPKNARIGSGVVRYSFSAVDWRHLSSPTSRRSVAVAPGGVRRGDREKSRPRPLRATAGLNVPCMARSSPVIIAVNNVEHSTFMIFKKERSLGSDHFKTLHDFSANSVRYDYFC